MMNNITHYEEVFSVDEAARILKISRRYIHKLIKEGKFGAMRIGKEYRIPKSVLDSYFNQASTRPYPEKEYGFGIWADRVDIPEESVDYVNRMRRESDRKELSEIITDAEKTP